MEAKQDGAVSGSESNLHKTKPSLVSETRSGDGNRESLEGKFSFAYLTCLM